MQEFLITSVDIGTKNISASVGTWKKDEDVEILGSSCIDSEGIVRGKLEDKDKCRKQFLKVLKKLEDENNVEISNIYLGLSGNNFRIEETECFFRVDGRIIKEDINRLINKCKKNISISKEEMICDIIINYYKVDDKITYKIPEEILCDKLGINVTICIMKRRVADDYRYLCDGTKYYIEEFMLNAGTLKNIFFNKSKRGTNFIVGFGASLTEVTQFKNGKAIKVIDIPLGGDDITNDISICAKIDFENAEKIKKEYSSSLKEIKIDEANIELDNGSLKKDLLFDICIARIEEILNYVKNELKKASHFNESCSIILYGDALTNFDIFSDLAKEIIGPNVSIVKKEDFGMKDFSDITSLAIVKEVRDKVELLYQSSSVVVEEFRKIESNLQMNENKIDKRDKKEEKSKKENKEINTSIIGKIRNFLGDIF